MARGQLTATSNVNLVENIGFGERPRTRSSDRDDLRPVEPIALPTAPCPSSLDEKADAWTRKHHFRADDGAACSDQADRYVRQRRGRTS